MPDTSAAAARSGRGPNQNDPLDTAVAAGPAELHDSSAPGTGSVAHSDGDETRPESALRERVAESTVVVADERAMVSLLGSRDVVLRQLEKSLAADIHVRGNRITLHGSAADIALAERVIQELLTLQQAGSNITPDSVRRTIGILADTNSGGAAPSEILGLNIISRRGRTIRPKTVNQKRYVDAIDASTIVFGIGPAGTGKTYLAMAKAVQSLQAKQVNRIILTRPAVEAGERLGFLPGTLSDKIDPYLRPLYDALHDMLDPESIPRLMAAGTIEVAPLAYMRGRTLNDAFIILDEAQNTTPQQMKMFLTRLGFGSKIVVTGDVTQVDLPSGQRSGLRVVSDILIDIGDVVFCQLTAADVVRHQLVGRIVEAYARWDAKTGSSAPDGQHRSLSVDGRWHSAPAMGDSSARPSRRRPARPVTEEGGS